MESWEDTYASQLLSCSGIPGSPQISRGHFGRASLLEVIFLYQRCWLIGVKTFMLAWRIYMAISASLSLALARPRGLGNLTLGFRARSVGLNSDCDT